MPSCIRAPPEAETMMTGNDLATPSSIDRVSRSPTTEPMLPPMKLNSKTHSTVGRPPMRAIPHTTASLAPVFSWAVLSRSR